MKKELLFSSIQEKVTALTTVQKVLLFVGTFAVLGAAFYFLQYKGQAERIKGLSAGIAAEQKKLATLKQAAARVPALQEEVAKAEEEFSRLLTLLPDQKEIPGLLDNVSQLGARVGLENILFQPQPEQPREFYAIIPVRLDLKGTYHELGLFFDQVSKLDRILKVENLSMTRQKDSKQVQILQVSCTIVTYRFLENPAPASPPPAKK